MPNFLRDYVLVIVILALGWGFWLHRIGVNDHDDAVSNELIFAREPVTTILSSNPWPNQSPIYFLVLHTAMNLGDSPFAIELFNALLLTVTLAATYVLGRAFSASRLVAEAALFLGVISPASLWLVRNGRMYSIQVLLSVLALLCLMRYYERRRIRDLVALAFLCVLNVYNHFIGFVITAVLLLPLVVEAWFESQKRSRGPDGTSKVWIPLLAPGLAALGILFLVLPQVFRLMSLVSAGAPLRPGWSLPGLSRTFLDRVIWFWFANSDWGDLRGGGRTLTVLFLGSIGILITAGVVAAGRRTAAVVVVWIVLPLLGLGLAAGTMDVRDRYFVWALPLLWVAIANGAFGPLQSRRFAGTAGDIARGVLSALFLAIVTASLWLLWNKLPDRYPQWTKLMLGLQQIYRPSMVVYMPSGPPMGTPLFLSSHLGLPIGLRDIRALNGATRARFEQEVQQAKDFVFLVHWTYANEEMASRARYLEEHGYRKAVLPVWGAHAEIFTRGEIDDFSRVHRIQPDPSLEAVVAWARQRLVEKRQPPIDAPVLAKALVARVHTDGTIREGRIFISQRGENGSWRLGPLEWDAVEEIRTSSGGIYRDVILAHPARDSVLVVAFPAMTLKESLSLLYGIADSGLRFRPGADVDLAVYVDGVKRAHVVSQNAPGWKALTVDTDGLQRRAADVVLLITTVDDRSRHFAFRLEASSRPPGAVSVEADDAAPAPAILTSGRTLKDSLERLKVRRIAGGRWLDARRDPRTYSASEMHETEGPAGEGTLRRQWVLGPMLWDAVGVTRQRSRGVARDGLWAHPKDGTTLVIEAPRAVLGSVLQGYVGMTDFSVARAAALGVTAPVRIRVLLDGRPVIENEVPRTRGWRTFAVPISGGPRERRLQVEISSTTDSWAHFVFDVWSN